MSLYLTRAELDRAAGTAALMPLLDPRAEDAAADAHHRLMWSLFPGADAKRDFLWRANGKGQFLVLSRREPVRSSIFRPLETKDFDPALQEGDRLSFLLRCNATQARYSRTGPRGRVSDIVMSALHATPGRSTLAKGQRSDRPALRMATAGRAAHAWMTAQGERHGFRLNNVVADDYATRRLRRHKGRDITVGVLDLRGELTVTMPDTFLAKIASGFGRSKAFGYGLMLIRRA